MSFFHRFSLIGLIYLIGSNNPADSQPLEFEEPFNDNENGWTTFSNPRGKSILDSGYLFLQNETNRGLFNLIHHFVDPREDFSLVTTVTHLSGSGSHGFVWGALGNLSFYSFQIFPDSTFRVIGNKNGEPFSLIPREKLPLGSYSHGKPAVLKVTKRGEKIGFQVNGYELATTQFPMFSGTEIGYSLEGKSSIKVDYLKIFQAPIEIRLATEFTGFEKENLGTAINSPFAENGVMISPDGTQMYVVRNGHPGNVGQMKKDAIWISTLTEAGSWSKLRRLGPPLNNRGSNFVISVAPDGNTLLVANTYKPDGSSAGPGLSLAHRSKEGWKVPEEVSIKGFNNRSRFVDFCLSPDRQVLIMAIDDGNTVGGMDLFASLKEGDEWSEPVSLGDDINTFANDFTPFVGADNLTLYFASFGHPGYGSADLFVSRRLDDTWTAWSYPENLGPDINTKNWDANLSIPARGDYAYLTSNENSIGNIDIFRIKLHQSLRPKPVVLIKGKVINTLTKEGMEAVINYYDLFDGSFLGEATSDPNDGSYRIVLPAGESYSFLAEKDNFYSVSENIDALGIDEYREIERDLYLGPIQKGSTIRLNNIFFETNRFNLKPESNHELNRLILLMNNFPNMKIELAGHTDDQGQEAYNQNLSELRAKEVYQYLLPYFSSERLEYAGYGESRPIAPNETEEGRQNNRRVEFTILSVDEE